MALSNDKLRNELSQLQALHMAAMEKASSIMSLMAEDVSTSSNSQNMADIAVARREKFIQKKVLQSKFKN